MNDVFIYRTNLINNLTALEKNSYTNISFEDFLSLIISTNPIGNIKLLDLLKKAIPTFRNNNTKVTVSSLISLANYCNKVGLQENINNQIINLLTIYNIIQSEDKSNVERITIMKEQYEKEKFKLISNILHY